MAFSLDLGELGKVGIGDILGAGSAIGSIAGGIIGAEGAREAGAATSRADLANAGIQGGNAGTDWQSYYQQKGNLDQRRNALEGKQRALYGAAGIAGDSGSPLDVMTDTENQFSEEAMNLFYNAKARATAAGEQAAADTEAAAAARKAASTQSTASIIGGIGSAALSIGKLFAFGL